MAKFNIDEKECVYPSLMKQNVFIKYAFEIDEDIAKGYIKSLFDAIASFMKVVKSEESPVALEVRTLKGEFLLAAVIRYEAPENTQQPGNWKFSYTFNEDDIKDVTVRHSYTDPQFGVILSNSMWSRCNFVWNIDATTGNKMTIEAIESLKSFLDVNVKEGEELELVCEDLFVATAAIEDGEKVFAIVPGAKSKEIAKEPKA